MSSLGQVSGLSMWIGRQLEPMSGLAPWAVTLLTCLLVSAVTEFASNPATLTVFLPILSALVRTHYHTPVTSHKQMNLRETVSSQLCSLHNDPNKRPLCPRSQRLCRSTPCKP